MRNYPPRAPQNPAGHWSTRRDRATQARFRNRVLHNAGHQCQFIHGIGGQRCQVTTDLQAHHTIPGNDDPVTGVALCRLHHKTIDKNAR